MLNVSVLWGGIDRLVAGLDFRSATFAGTLAGVSRDQNKDMRITTATQHRKWNRRTLSIRFGVRLIELRRCSKTLVFILHPRSIVSLVVPRPTKPTNDGGLADRPLGANAK